MGAARIGPRTAPVPPVFFCAKRGSPPGGRLVRRCHAACVAERPAPADRRAGGVGGELDRPTRLAAPRGARDAGAEAGSEIGHGAGPDAGRGVGRDAGPRWRLVAAAPLLAAAFYLRYGSAPVIALALGAAGLIWW